MDRGIHDLRTLLHTSEQAPQATSGFGFAVLVVGWSLTLLAYAVLAADLAAHPQTVPSGGGLAAALAAIVLLSMRIAPILWLSWLALPLGLARLILPRDARRALTRLFFAWCMVCAVAVAGLFGVTPRGHFAAILAAILLSAEGLRIAIAAALRRSAAALPRSR